VHNKASLVLGVASMIVAGGAVVSAWGWPAKAALFPLVISIPLFLLAAAEVLWALLGSAPRGNVSDFKLSDHLPQGVALRRTLIAAGWILGFFLAILLLGFLVAVPVFVLLYLRLQGRRGWIFSAVFTAVVWAFFYGLFDLLLHLPFPAGWIPSLLGVR
jgi:tripartite tricarboxylate transporter TctB family protein